MQSDSEKESENLEEEHLVENEPYLGPAWAVAMFILYLLKETFPAEPYTPLWWFQNYIVMLVVLITIFTLVKRHQFYRDSHDEIESEEENKDG